VTREALGAGVRGIESIDAGLGTRRFFRVELDRAEPATAIARVEAPEDPAVRPAGAAPEPPLEPIRALLEAHGLPVPRRYGASPAAGLELLEDAGPISLRDAVATASPAERRALYAEACGLVPRLQRVAAGARPVEAFSRRLDAALFAYKAELFCEHSLPLALGRAPASAAREVVRAAFARIAAIAAEAPARLAHRDFQSSNLYVQPSPRRLVMIDLQGAFLAPPEYDLVCLLRDSYVELPAAEVDEQLARVRPALPDAPDAGSFARRFDLLTLTRKGKDHARFVSSARSRGRSDLLRHLPTTVCALRGAAQRAAAREPAFAALAELVLALPESACAG
jgi:hypothetical protein